MTRPKVRMNYDPSEDPGISFPEPTRTKQSEMAACDINNILKRYQKTGQLPDLIKQNPQYGDFTNVLSYQESLNTVAMAQAQFNALDAHIRERFMNDPARFLEFATNPKNNKELIRLGLAVERPAPPQAGDPLSGTQKPSGKAARQPKPDPKEEAGE